MLILRTMFLFALGFVPAAGQIPGLSPRTDAVTHQNVPLHFKRGDFVVFHYPAQLDSSAKIPKALILFGGGGGGWSYWEERFCHKLQTEGYEVIGLDFAPYAKTDYNLDILQRDFQTMAEYGLKPYGEHGPPLIVSGWSTGAEQAVAVAGGPRPPGGLVGLLLIAPGSWGGYGWFATADFGPRVVKTSTFDLTDFAPNLTRLRIAQWHAAFDITDSRSWLASLKAPHREYDLANCTHDYGEASDEFLNRLDESVAWILGKDTDSSGNAHSPVP